MNNLESINTKENKDLVRIHPSLKGFTVATSDDLEKVRIFTNPTLSNMVKENTKLSGLLLSDKVLKQSYKFNGKEITLIGFPVSINYKGSNKVYLLKPLRGIDQELITKCINKSVRLEPQTIDIIDEDTKQNKTINYVRFKMG